MRVKLLSCTENPLDIIYMSYRQCYFPGSVIDMDLDERSEESKEKFITSRIREKHLTGIESVTFTFAIAEISRACSHQLVRHRIASHNQQSQRFCESKDQDGNVCIRFTPPPGSILSNQRAQEIYWDCRTYITHAYRELRELEIPKEDARSILPNATETNLVCTFNCRSLLNMFELRMDEHAQKEFRQVACKMFEACFLKVPCVFKHLEPLYNEANTGFWE